MISICFEKRVSFDAKLIKATKDGHIRVKNLSAFWLPELTLQKEIGGTIYSVTGTYDGIGMLDKKMERIVAEKFAEELGENE